MVSEKIIYIHVNGEVEGFLGIGETMGQAHKDAIKKIKEKVKMTDDTFDEGRIKKDLKGLTAEERNKVLEDFNRYMQIY